MRREGHLSLWAGVRSPRLSRSWQIVHLEMRWSSDRKPELRRRALGGQAFQAQGSGLLGEDFEESGSGIAGWFGVDW